YVSVGESLAQLCIAEVSLLGEYAPVLMRHACADPIVRAPDVHPDVPHGLEALSGALPEPLAKAYLAVIFGRILERLPLEPVRPQEEEDLLPRAMRYLQENVRETLTLERVACALSVSKYRLSRLFSGQVGLGFSAIVNALRVELAQTMLREGRLPVTQVLYACGFESERTFYRAFQTHCQMTPKQYKQAAAQLTAPSDERQAGEEHA
ncbi:MAG TPA: AraC family transcriptional regulator, partial [Clostridia bacterium]|nr:AraC family transcriptional regulator [Clostridia bacterium]